MITRKACRRKLGKCFAAGTLVLTPDGVRAIETLQPGDRVLTDVEAGGPERTSSIVSVYRSTAPRTLRLVAGGETITTTEGHPFASIETGWIKAGDLKPGDLIMARSGPIRVDAVEVGPAHDVWNLKLAEHNTYLVGRMGTMVHDITPVVDGSW